MNTLSQPAIIGKDVSRDWLDIHCLEDGKRLRFANTLAGHKKVTKLALERKALVCFEATGGQEWQHWASLDEAGIITRQLPPAQIKAFAASCGTRAKTDAIDAELIARFMAFRPQAGRQLPYEKLGLLRALTTKRSQLVEARKRLLAQIKACEKQVHTPLFITMDTELRLCLNKQISELESQIEKLLQSDASLAQTSTILRSVPGVGPVTSAMLVAEMPELGQISAEQAAALTGLAPIAQDSGRMKGKRTIAGGRRTLRNVLFQAALVARYHNPLFKSFAERLKKAGKVHKVIITAVARKLITILNAMCKTKQKWEPKPT